MIHSIVALTWPPIDPCSCYFARYENSANCNVFSFPFFSYSCSLDPSLSLPPSPSPSRWLSADKGECGTSVNLKVTPQQPSKERNHGRTTQFVTTPSSQVTPSSQHVTPLLHYSKQSDKIPSHENNLSLTKRTTILEHGEPNQPENLEDNHTNVAEGNGNNERGNDSYNGEEFESYSESEEGSEVDVEGGRDSRGGERSDVEADRHDTLFSDTQEMDSSITNQYLRQLRYVMSYLTS